jgi:hypothetical protein
MYQWQEEMRAHAAFFYRALTAVINTLREGNGRFLSALAAQKAYVDTHYNWDLRAVQWEAFLRSIASLPPQG